MRDLDGSIVDFVFADAHDAACRHNGLGRTELLGMRLLELLPDHAGDMLARYAAVVDTGRPLAEDAVPFPTSGETRYFANRAVAVSDDGRSFTWRDITEHVLIRNELEPRVKTDSLTGMLNRDRLDEARAEKVDVELSPDSSIVHRLGGQEHREDSGS